MTSSKVKKEKFKKPKCLKSTGWAHSEKSQVM
jgi:hypothetical protein